MPQTPGTIAERLDSLRDELARQGGRVQSAVETSVEAVFERDKERAGRVAAMDDEIDRVDVQIEKHAVALLTDAARHGSSMDEHDVRMVLTIVKVNNEFERIADLAVDVASRIEAFIALGAVLPAKFRVMANSVIGIVQLTNRAFSALDTGAARTVLASDDATEAFKYAILRDMEEGLAAGKHNPDFAFAMNTVAAALARMADHCTNIAEQVIYVETGKIVRHMGDRWTEPESPGV